MVSLASSATEYDGVTLVAARVTGSGAIRRVRLANRLDGPVWPPRTDGVPESGWDEAGVECVVRPDETVAVGYASPASPADPPIELTECERVDGDADPVDSQATVAVRDLSDPAPPRDALPIPAAATSAPAGKVVGRPATDDERTDRPPADDVPADRHPAGDTSAAYPAADQPPADGGPAAGKPADGTADRNPPRVGCTPAPRTDSDATDAWLDAVEQRVTTAERLAAIESVPDATAALREVGGLAAAESAVAAVEADVRDLEATATRARELADRARATDVPLATLERLS